MKNLRELYTDHPCGFDGYGAWLDAMHACFALFPLDAPEFGAEWLRRWEVVGRLLQKPAASRNLNPISALGCSPKATADSAGMLSSIYSSTCKHEDITIIQSFLFYLRSVCGAHQPRRACSAEINPTESLAFTC